MSTNELTKNAARQNKGNPFSLLAALESAMAGGWGEEFRAGDLTVKRSGGSAASNCLFNQAELVIAPYLEDRFAFLGV